MSWCNLFCCQSVEAQEEPYQQLMDDSPKEPTPEKSEVHKHLDKLRDEVGRLGGGRDADSAGLLLDNLREWINLGLLAPEIYACQSESAQALKNVLDKIGYLKKINLAEAPREALKEIDKIYVLLGYQYEPLDVPARIMINH
jgi:hypothetical protein